jgi:cysteine-S-conjugate beta-lyase
MGTYPESSRFTDLPVDPLPIADTDVALADPIAAALTEAIEQSGTGYASPAPDLAESLAEFAAARWNRQIDPGQVTSGLDVGVGVVRLLPAPAPRSIDFGTSAEILEEAFRRLRSCL